MRGMRFIIGALLCGSFLIGCDQPKQPELVVFCAAGIKNPVSRAARQFEQDTGVAVRLQFAGSGTLLSSLQVAPGDIYLAADSSYIDEARKRNLINDSFLIAYMKAGFGVAKGNPKKLSSLNDLNNEGLRVAIGNPEAASIGRFTQKVLTKHGVWDSFTPTVTFPTVNELANAIKLDAVDVAILWDAVAHQYPEVDFVSITEFDVERKDVTVAITKASAEREHALAFCRFLAAPEKGRSLFVEQGFTLP